MKKRGFIFILSLMTAFLLLLAGCGESSDAFTLRYEAGLGGYIEGRTVQTVQAGESGEEVTAVVLDGFVFVGWSDGVKTLKRRDGDISFDLTVEAQFARDTSALIAKYKITYDAGSGGHIEGSAIQTVQEGESGEEVTATAEKDFKFVRWSDGVQTATRREIDLHHDVWVRAEFRSVPSKTQSVSAHYETTEGGYIEGNADQTIWVGGNGEPVKAIPQTGYEFLQWSDAVKTAWRQDRDVHVAVNVKAYFKPLVLTLRYTTDGNGTIEGEDFQTVIYGESGTVVTAVPNEGYEFYAWSDGMKCPTRQATSVHGSDTFVAEFRTINQPVKAYTVRYEAGEGGYVAGALVQTVHRGESGSSVLARPNEGYVFAGWSDGVKTIARREENVQKDVTVKALFEKIEEPAAQKDSLVLWGEIRRFFTLQLPKKVL